MLLDMEMTGTLQHLSVTDHYEIGLTIGEGSFAVVKAGRHIDTGTAVAIKIVDKMCARFDESLLKSEISTMMQCDHPNCVVLFQVFDEPEKTYMVMELLTGGNVMDRIVELDHCSEQLTSHVVKQVLAALQYLHGIGIIHRDLKPENLLYASADPECEKYNTIKLADFGLARIMMDDCLKTMCGTPAYVAPEVLNQRKKKSGYHCEVDLWSLGVVVYVMLSGFLPFSHDSKPALFEIIRRGEFDFPSPWWDDVSAEAKDLVNNLLVVNPAHRFTIDQCLAHPWIQNDGVSAHRLHSSHHAFLLLRNLKIFENVEPSCLQELVGKLRTVHVNAGHYIARAGDEGDSMYFIKKGSVQVLCDGSQIDKLFTGDFFGEIALTVSQTRIADLLSLGSVAAPEATDERMIASPIGVGEAPRAGATSRQVALTCSNEARGPVELLQLLRSDFQQLLINYPVLKSRFACIGQARVKRQARAVMRRIELEGHAEMPAIARRESGSIPRHPNLSAESFTEYLQDHQDYSHELESSSLRNLEHFMPDRGSGVPISSSPDELSREPSDSTRLAKRSQGGGGGRGGEGGRGGGGGEGGGRGGGGPYSSAPASNGMHPSNADGARLRSSTAAAGNASSAQYASRSVSKQGQTRPAGIIRKTAPPSGMTAAEAAATTKQRASMSMSERFLGVFSSLDSGKSNFSDMEDGLSSSFYFGLSLVCGTAAFLILALAVYIS